VLDISLFNTTLGHTDRSRVVIPSRKIVGEILHNCGQIRRLPLLANVAYGTDIATALALVNEVLAGNERVLKTPAPVVGVARLTDACVSININPWVNVPDYEAAISEINQAVLAAFRAHGIVIPLPQREVRML
jgi:small conductance mechanosensitive channel